MRIASLSALLVLLSSSAVLATADSADAPISTALEVNADQSINPAEVRAPHQKRTFCYYFGTCAVRTSPPSRWVVVRIVGVGLGEIDEGWDRVSGDETGADSVFVLLCSSSPTSTIVDTRDTPALRLSTSE